MMQLFYFLRILHRFTFARRQETPRHLASPPNRKFTALKTGCHVADSSSVMSTQSARPSIPLQLDLNNFQLNLLKPSGNYMDHLL
jgi:hypothetical protein